MSARLDWRPTRNDWKGTSGQSAAGAALERAFGRFPDQLSTNDLPTLRGMMAADPAGPWRELIDAIEDHKQIDLKLSY